MNKQSPPFFNSSAVKLVSSVFLACTVLGLAACTTTRSSAPVQVAASNPTVTYKYHDDDGLIQANQQAMTFCHQYQALPLAQSFGQDADHNNIVIFECAESTKFAATPARQLNSDLAYNFRTDQELLDVSRDAQVYCLNRGSPEMNSNITTHNDGSKTVTFHCSNR